MSGGGPRERKQDYLAKVVQLLEEYPKILIVLADNVGSHHMQKIRVALRKKATILMGKNTLVRKALKGQAQNNEDLENLLPYVKGNVGFVFTKGNLSEIKKIIEENKVEAPAKAGGIAPSDVIVPAGNTGLEPTKTSFFQALNIGSKISKGQIEILNDVHLIKEGDKVGSSEATLLQMLGIKPFKYGLKLLQIYDNGSVYSPKVLDITEVEILDKFREGVQNIASISLQIGYPTLASLPHSILNAYKNILAVSLATEYTFEASKKIKDYLANPSAFAVAAAPAPAKKEEKKEEKKPEKEEKKKEPEPEEDEEMGFGLFDD